MSDQISPASGVLTERAARAIARLLEDYGFDVGLTATHVARRCGSSASAVGRYATEIAETASALVGREITTSKNGGLRLFEVKRRAVVSPLPSPPEPQ